MLVATAGHIDHGKTSLIRALTGVETDRLPEEKARGISIDLGFAYWRPDTGETIGFVDVPGHERFVRNMLAGVSAIDVALLVVAADDGVMPQTVEHVQILDLLGVARALVAVTKTDRASPEQIEAARRDIDALLAPTAMAGAAAFAVSSVTGEGLDNLADALLAAREVRPRRDSGDRHFRLAIDRAFSVTGAGAVVTGVVLDGAVEAGERLVLSPRGLEVRVRGLQSGGAPAARVGAGERCAVNLAGVELSQARRGDWLTAPDIHVPTSRLEAKLKVLAGATGPLKHHAPVHLHLGAADLAARVLIRGQTAIPPRGETAVLLVTDRPVSAVHGDRFVIRDPSGRRTLGGGRITDPRPEAGRRRNAQLQAASAAWEAPDAAATLRALLAIPGHEVDLRRFELGFNLRPGAAQALYRRLDLAMLGHPARLAMPTARAEAIQAEIIGVLETFHAEHPDLGGLAPGELKARLAQPVSPEAFLALQKRLAETGAVETQGALVKLAGHSARLSPGDSLLWRRLLALIEARGDLVFTAADLAQEMRTSETVIATLLHRMRANGEVWRITDKRFLLREQASALAATADRVARGFGDKGFTAAQYRDAIGTGRTLAIQILEFFDSVGVTRRAGDLRWVRPDFELLIGAAPPYAPAPARPVEAG